MSQVSSRVENVERELTAFRSEAAGEFASISEIRRYDRRLEDWTSSMNARRHRQVLYEELIARIKSLGESGQSAL